MNKQNGLSFIHKILLNFTKFFSNIRTNLLFIFHKYICKNSDSELSPKPKNKNNSVCSISVEDNPFDCSPESEIQFPKYKVTITRKRPLENIEESKFENESIIEEELELKKVKLEQPKTINEEHLKEIKSRFLSRELSKTGILTRIKQRYSNTLPVVVVPSQEELPALEIEPYQEHSQSLEIEPYQEKNESQEVQEQEHQKQEQAQRQTSDKEMIDQEDTHLTDIPLNYSENDIKNISSLTPSPAPIVDTDVEDYFIIEQ